MGLLLSILNAFASFFVSTKYASTTLDKKYHKSCRSTNPNKLISYQSKIDNLKSSEIVYRTHVPDDKVDWWVNWPQYQPVDYTSPRLIRDKPAWADVQNPLDIKNWNMIDGKTDRRSHVGCYELSDGIPVNPCGRTGIRGRGQLGKWGPNHAADPIVTRWKRDEQGNKVFDAETNKPILQFVSIRRLDTNEWAIPGGMCDPGEKISQTLKREFMEEATDCLGKNSSSRDQIENHLNHLFEKGVEIFRGYVDDPRNTDNAWMETIAYNFHDEDDTVFKEFSLSAGDDAGSVTWMDIDQKLKLYASHKNFVQKAAELHNAHW
ncbi:ADP-ribose mitochondrial-like [Brachionus plicatilis]|uniref:ADP-ribose mitochondrial-like n=1 Tax=Brachionus plicatilis TaxID=10195 RepID=A0A3M7QXY5_BRAPC|nr:ADP-ribose mitochondrial-like [Brachionus plicatilis]